jgi:hemoglobin
VSDEPAASPASGADPDAVPSATLTPFLLVGGAERVRQLVEKFYDVMEEREPELTALHRRDADGHIPAEFRERFALFLIGWLGGPQDYMERHGHPRLRMRHGRVAVNHAMKDAWVRCMTAAMDAQGIRGPVREFLDRRFAEVSDFLRNVPG